MIVLPMPLRGLVSRRVGAAVAALGGLLVLFEAAAFASGVASAWVVTGFLIGAGMLLAALAASRAGRYSQALGAVVLVLSILSFFGLSGFLVGAFLGSLGGTILVLTPGFGFGRSAGRPRVTSADLGPPCPTCGRHVPTWTTTCPYCAASK